MIKLQPNTFTADLLPISNPRQKEMDEKELWTMKVNEMLKSRLKPLNAPNVISQKISFQKIVNGLIGQIGDSGQSTGIWAIGRFAFGGDYLQDPSLYKLTNVNDITLSVNISFIQLQNFATAPTPTGNYTMKMYVVLQELSQGLEITENNVFLVIPFDFVYETTPERFYFSQPTQVFRLAETVNRESIQLFGTEYPNLLTNPTKITTGQYNQLASSTTTIVAGWGFDIGQLDGSTPTPNPVLSANNKAHFEYFLFGNSSAFDGFTFLDINVSGIVNYSGLFANYEPIS